MIRADEVHATWRALPPSPDDPMLLRGRAMILAPHPDDETLGCGGLIAELCALGRPPAVVIVTDGTGSHPNSRRWQPEQLRDLREAEAGRATAELGLNRSDLHFMRLRDTAVPRAGPEFDKVCAAIAAQVGRAGCDTLLAPWLFDPHCDHEAVSMMARQVTRHLGLRLLSYPVWGWLLDANTTIPLDRSISGFQLDFSRHCHRKRRAIRLHASQYSDLITDDPTGFCLPPALLSIFEGGREYFLEAS